MYSCNCGNGDLHTITCAVNWDEFTMIDSGGDIWYPDCKSDADYFILHHDVQYIGGGEPCWPED